MPHSYGIRARTRHMFARNFREHGMPIKLTTYLKTYKVGDIVDIKANGAIHKGMPHKFYHGYVFRLFLARPFLKGSKLLLLIPTPGQDDNFFSRTQDRKIRKQ